MINQATIERILEAAPIEAVIGEYVTLKKRGANYIACCPFHNEKTPSFSVSPSRGIFKCFGCGKAGNVVRFIMEHEQLTYVEALKFLGNKYNIPVEEKEETQQETESRLRRDSLLLVNGYARDFYSNYLWEEKAGQDAGLSYFRERGFTEHVIRHFQLGYAPAGKDTFTRAALAAGYKPELLIATGLTIHFPERENKPEAFMDRYQDRVIFPIHSLSGRVIGFGGRTLRSDKQVSKYINSPDSEVYNKSRSLYGIYYAKQDIVKGGKCYLVEGYTDVISLFQAGITNVVASSGTSLTVEQIRLIKRFTQKVTVLYDGDDAGIRASIRGIDMLLEEGLQVKVVRFPQGDDPDSFARSHNARETLDFLEKNETDFIHFKIALMADEMKDPLKKSALIREVVESIAIIPDAITRTVYIEECSRHLDIEEMILTREVAKIRKKRTEWVNRPSSYPPPPPLPPGEENIQEAELKPGSGELSRCEQDILYYLIKFGQTMIEDMTVSEFIQRALAEDELEFQDPFFAGIFREYATLTGDDEARKKFFIHHESPLISQHVLDLISNPHPINVKVLRESLPLEEPMLKENVTKALLVYKLKIVSLSCADLTRDLRQAQQLGEEEKIQTILKELAVMMDVRNSFARELNRLK
ncbi:MAG TPA: DNA primase [Bacteroidales bacterium]|nr:DNA primase [Bacteroidales bacterium]HOQ96317.1 DNA primase [Bacteroidales bacterium]HPL84426.1 DNA primase [Bacteroidales bacterium]